ncbi:MAG: tRNA uridine-5-carboxymethylaminomethyl(34) synthesis GTPase MnmE [Clostridiales bacterium]|nr:tRNA uridine-5-carboxymethylaminomethyl(34) synthesis GTPase MnmE [Clostridiales bacterium]
MCYTIKFMEKTICAISTPIGVGGISVIRLSGKESINIVNTILENKIENLEPRKMLLKKIKTKSFCDNAIIAYFKAPFSYTGEDVIEIQCHGGIYITNEILKALIKNGATIAENGEFTKRAFLNGKLSLDKAEGVIDMINAESEEQAKAAYSLMNGNLSTDIKSMQDVLTDILAEVEVSIDYPEHDIEYTTTQKFVEKVTNLKEKINNLINTSETGMLIKNGINVAILGSPNVGKSSLMNALLGYKRAIVTNIAGTTRDTITESYVYNGIKVNLIDTAGIRESDNEVEQIGISLAKEKLDTADLILFVIDSTRQLNDDEKELLDKIKNKKVVIVINKIDEKKHEFTFENQIEISTLKNLNIEKLKQKIYDEIINKNIIGNSTIITNTRHKIALENAQKSLEDSLKTLENTENLELFSIDLQNAFLFLGEITGDSNKENIIDRIFSKFCLGK